MQDFRVGEDELDQPDMLEVVRQLVDDARCLRRVGLQFVRLRKKLEQAGAAEPIIKAIRGSGYQFG